MIPFRVPAATYRIQFNLDFRFADALERVAYLNSLGVTDLYSSPRFKARRGSSHGYDVANPSRVNSELGTEEDFDELAEKLRHYRMGLVLDIVPNHMAASPENPWWMDVLENGEASAYAEYFDIDWRPLTGKAAFLQQGRVLLPVLGDLYGNVLRNQELSLRIDDTGFFVRYYDHKFPVSPRSYRMILEGAGMPEIDALRARAADLPPRWEKDPARLAERREGKEALKRDLWQLYLGDDAARGWIDEALRRLSGHRDDPRSFDRLDAILAKQAYRLADWRAAYEEINYRRFFDINELVGLRVEIPEVFDLRHGRALELAAEGKVSGFRIDHVDGLYDPLQYLERLQEAVRQRGGEGRFYVVTEKILSRDEPLPEDWPVQGSTGYEFGTVVNGVFVDPQGLAEIEQAYAARTGAETSFADLCYACNKLAMEGLFAGEVNVMTHELGRLAAAHREARDVRQSELREALVEVTSCLPRYRTYVRDLSIGDADRRDVEAAFRVARERTPPERASAAAFDFLLQVLTLDAPYYLEDKREDWLRFTMRWQQLSGPVMAKGLEDTAAYRHNSLVSLNEVGSDPLRQEPPAGPTGFHRFNAGRLNRWPDSMNATATHDSKRGEDVRARINVLSEMPGEWAARWDEWRGLNGSFDPPTESLIYQMLLGAWPLEEAELAGFPARFAEFAVKAAREAKVHTSWIRVSDEYESALRAFVAAVFENAAFLESFHPFQRRIAFHGALNSLSQVLLKIASPGVPDFYQGTEFWSLTMVDPDNRRPVDYRAREAMLDDLDGREAQGRRELARSLARDWSNHALKLYTTAVALRFRRSHADLFRAGEYTPLTPTGPRAECAVAFVRGGRAAIVAPRLTTRLCSPPDPLSWDWGDTAVDLPEAPAWRNAFTGETAASNRLADLLCDFPVALLEAQ